MEEKANMGEFKKIATACMTKQDFQHEYLAFLWRHAELDALEQAQSTPSSPDMPRPAPTGKPYAPFQREQFKVEIYIGKPGDQSSFACDTVRDQEAADDSDKLPSQMDWSAIKSRAIARTKGPKRKRDGNWWLISRLWDASEAGGLARN
ncbi:Uu.00g016750.m01.CDS01 [Anthostomella pinea]|uniref:Uu.00g016750.m01.CDS01 n=1 Tax=Anthostomella pinea TaxID=933095 RepID=A0AAI8VSZ3_9PEZI|nr:Uu.00g016750.m01.CDS01 [Anthostomella pinea]